MGNIESKPPLDITEFRKLESPLEEYIIPEVPQKRKVTDLTFLIVFGSVLGLLAIFIIYCGTQSRLSLHTRGYDSCGNVCGEKNPFVGGIECSGKDMTVLPYTQYIKEEKTDYSLDVYGEVTRESHTGLHYECVGKCRSDSTLIFNRCIPDLTDLGTEMITDTLSRGAGLLIAQIIIGLGATIGMLALFRYFTKFIFWYILISSWFGLLAFTMWLWSVHSESSPNREVRLHAITFTVITIGLGAVIIFLFKKITLIIKLYKESIKAVFTMPLLLLEPFLSVLSFVIGIICFVYVNILIYTSGYLTSTGYDQYEYQLNFPLIFAFWLNLIGWLWMSQFIIGCQHMVIAGAISSYYFARNKVELVSPIYRSFYSLVRYHLGTVAFGSLVITIVMIIKGCIRLLSSNRLGRVIALCCMNYIERALKFLTLNAYIQTAMHGQGFIQSGKRAVQLLFANAVIVIATNFIGEFVLFMAKMKIVAITLLVGVAMQDDSLEAYWVILAISAFITFIISHVFFVVFETAVDTLLLCYCEDKMLNDGTTKPYYMTKDLAGYMNDAKAQYAKSQS